MKMCDQEFDCPDFSAHVLVFLRLYKDIKTKNYYLNVPGKQI